MIQELSQAYTDPQSGMTGMPRCQTFGSQADSHPGLTAEIIRQTVSISVYRALG